MNKTSAIRDISVLMLSIAFQSVRAIGPSDCSPGRADSTCSSSLLSKTVSQPPSPPPTDSPTTIVYDGILAGVPASGYSYWGFDFTAYQLGIPTSIPRDMFLNHSNDTIQITLSFDIPADSNCGSGCLPGIEFKVNAQWNSIFPTVITQGTKASATLQVAPNQYYGWVIGLWSASNPKLHVESTRLKDLHRSDVGLPEEPGISTPIAGAGGIHDCSNGTSAAYYSGTRYSTGLMGYWYKNSYTPWDAYDLCPIESGGGG